MHEANHQIRSYLSILSGHIFPGNELQIQYLRSVSYTHLDVYKRQADRVGDKDAIIKYAPSALSDKDGGKFAMQLMADAYKAKGCLLYTSSCV